MPKFGMTMTEGTIVEWAKKPGDNISVGDVIASIETEKVVSDLESETAGTLTEVLFAEDEDVSVGEVIAVMEV